METEIEHIDKCNCGAITVTIDNENYSMSRKVFNKLFGKHRLSVSVCNCNHCVNHWGIDLCACGSGEHPNRCKEGFKECGQPMQALGEKQEVSMWR